MNKFKEFYKKHEVEILVVGGIGVVVIATALATRKITLDNIKAKDLAKTLSQDVMTWKDHGHRVSLEKAKALLDINNGSRDTFAIVHIGGTVDKFQVVVCK